MVSKTQEPTFFLLKRRLPASETEDMLGRIVRLFEDPLFAYTPESPAKSLTPEIFNQFVASPQHDDSAQLRTKASQDEKLWAKLKGLFSLSSEFAEGGSTLVTSPRITTRRLKQEITYFNALKSVPDVRREILEMCSVGGKVYLIVGTVSVQTATFKSTGFQRSKNKAAVSLPVSAVASAAAASGGVILPISGVDPELGTGHSTSSSWSTQFTTTATGADGEENLCSEEVFAVACREITREWHGLGSDVKMRLKRPQYTGGQHFGEGDESDQEKEEEDEDAELAAAETLRLADSGFNAMNFGADPVVVELKTGCIACM